MALPVSNLDAVPVLSDAVLLDALLMFERDICDDSPSRTFSSAVMIASISTTFTLFVFKLRLTRLYPVVVPVPALLRVIELERLP